MPRAVVCAIALFGIDTLHKQILQLSILSNCVRALTMSLHRVFSALEPLDGPNVSTWHNQKKRLPLGSPKRSNLTFVNIIDLDYTPLLAPKNIFRQGITPSIKVQVFIFSDASIRNKSIDHPLKIIAILRFLLSNILRMWRQCLCCSKWLAMS